MNEGLLTDTGTVRQMEHKYMRGPTAGTYDQLQ